MKWSPFYWRGVESNSHDYYNTSKGSWSKIAITKGRNSVEGSQILNELNMLQFIQIAHPQPSAHTMTIQSILSGMH